MSYRDAEGINYSTLKYMADSPMEYRLACDKVWPESDAKRFGTMVHMGLLERDRFHDTYRKVLGHLAWTSKETKERTIKCLWAARNRDIPPEQLERLLKFKKGDFERYVDSVSEEDGKVYVFESSSTKSQLFTWERFQAMMDANMNKPIFLNMYKKVEAVEVPLFAPCKTTGLKLKGLADLITKDSLTDAKTVSKLKDRYARMHQFRYTGQLAFYDYLMRLLGEPRERQCILWLETSYPFKVKLMQIDPDEIAFQHSENIKLLKQVKLCMEKDEWPDGSEEVEFYEYREKEGSEEPDLDELETGQDEY